jgi:fibronectin-binding autotransporter adhesin
LANAWLILTNTAVANETLFVGDLGGFSSSLLAGGTSVWAGPVVVAGTAYAYFGSHASRPDYFLDVRGAISGEGDVCASGGTVRFSGSQANTYSGNTYFEDGIIELFKSVPNGAVPGALMIGRYDGSQTATNRLLNNNQIANTSEVTVYEGSLLDLNDHADWIGALTLDGGEVQTGTGTLTLGGDVTVEANTNRIARIAGRVSLNGTRAFDIANSPFSPDLDLAASVSGTGGLTKTGPGTLRLSGSSANTYLGTTLVNEGELILSTVGGAIPNGALAIGDPIEGTTASVFEGSSDQIGNIPVTINAGSTLEFDDWRSDTIGALTLNGGEVFLAMGTLTLEGDLTVLDNPDHPARLQGFGSLALTTARTFDIANTPFFPDLELRLTIAGAGGFTKTGAGALGLYDAGTFTGTATLSAGTVYLYNDAALGSTSGGTVVNAGAMLLLPEERHVGAEPLTLNGTGISNYGALRSGYDSNSWAGPITLASDSLITVLTNGHLNLSGAIGGAAGFTKNGPGTLILSGSSANTFAGNAVVNEGILLLDKSGVDHALPGPGNLIIGDGVGGGRAVVVRELRDYQIDGSVDITVNISGMLDLNDCSDSVGGVTLNTGVILTGDGTLTLGGDVGVSSVDLHPALIRGHLALGSVSRTFTVAESSYLSLDASVSGTGGLTKNGPGWLWLESSNSFSGLTTVSEGGVTAGDDHSLGASTAGTILNGGTLGLSHVSITNEALTVNSASELKGGDTNRWTGDVILNATLSVSLYTNFPTPARLELSGAINGIGGITKLATGHKGVLVLNGTTANTYAGDTRVLSGTLELDKFGTDGAVPGNLIIGDGIGGAGADVVRLERANQIANTADVTINSSGVFDLNGYYDRIDAVTGSGAITLGSGHLIAGHSSSSFTFDGLVSGTGYLWKVGDGTWTLTASNTYSGTTWIESGTLLVNGAQPASDVGIQSLGTLGGTGAVGRVTSAGGLLSPGLSPGTLTSSNVLLDSATDLLVELTGTGADRLNVRGKVGLGDASLILSAAGLLPTEGQRFLIVNNDEADAVTGTFAGLPEGALVRAGPRQFHITYKGGDGNDVVLTATNTAALRPALSIWRTATNSVVVSWPQSDIGWLLHATTNLGRTPILWTEIPAPYQTNGRNLQFIEPRPVGNKFYRLHDP